MKKDKDNVFELIEIIHQGKKSIVYRATEKLNGNEQEVIIKLIRSGRNKKNHKLHIANEAKILNFFKNENGIVQIHHTHELDNEECIVMDYAGIPLINYLKEVKLSLKDKLELMINLSKIMEVIHAKEIIHKDINPTNIIINPNNKKQITYIDFGISSMLVREKKGLKSTNLLEGTLPYMAPEQTGRMNRTVDFRSDYYSLGMTFYEILTGKPPFLSEDPMELVHFHIARIPLAPHIVDKSIPDMISRIVMKLIEKMAEDRYQTTKGLIHDLNLCLEVLQCHKKIELFELGQNDVSSKFQISQKLYGREEAILTLMNSFDQVSAGDRKILFVYGVSGIGKSSVVNEIHKNIAKRGGQFITGKFDQLKRGYPLWSIVSAFTELMKRILSYPSHKLEKIREKIQIELGNNIKVIVDILPLLGTIVGEVPELPPLPDDQSRNRFNITLLKFIKIFSSPEDPLVLFLDDLQWADNASLSVIQTILTSSDLKHILIIGAYRDNEIDLQHPLTKLMNILEEEKSFVEYIEISQLNVHFIEEMLVDICGDCPIQQKELAELIYQKTEGNPFFIVEYLKNLYQESLISFDHKKGQWKFLIEQIKSTKITDNVVELMIEKINYFDEKCQHILQLGACLGNCFDIKTVSLITKFDINTIGNILWEVLKSGILIPTDESYRLFQGGDTELDGVQHSEDFNIYYRFAHDRIQQAAYSMIPEDDKERYHFEIGVIMHSNYNKKQLEENTFLMVGHLNKGRKYYKKQEERTKLGILNLKAGEKAIWSSAYNQAYTYLKIGAELLPEKCWQEYYHETYQIHLNMAKCEFFLGIDNDIHRKLDNILKQAKSLEHRLNVRDLKVLILKSVPKYLEAFQEGNKSLKELGINIPQYNVMLAMVPRLIWTILKYRNLKISELEKLEEIKDSRQKLILQTLQSSVNSAYLYDDKLGFLICLISLNRALKWGESEYSPYYYATMSIIIGPIAGNWKLAKQLAEFSLKMMEKYNNLHANANALLVIAAAVMPWFYSFKETKKYLDKAYQLFNELGDGLNASYILSALLEYNLIEGKKFQETKEAVNYLLDFSSKRQLFEIYEARIFYKQLIKALSGETNHIMTLNDNEFDQDLAESKIDRKKGGMTYVFLKLYQMILAYHSNDFEKAIEYGKKIANIDQIFLTSPPTIIYKLVIGHCYLVAQFKAKGVNKLLYRLKGKLLFRYIKRLYKLMPENYEGYYFLLEAEKCGVKGRFKDCHQLYQKVIEISRKNNNWFLRCVAYKHLFLSYYRQDLYEYAKIALLKTIESYQEWGAKGIVGLLLGQYQHIINFQSCLTTEISTLGNITIDPETGKSKGNLVTTTSSGNILDVSTLTKAYSVLSSEIVMSKLIKKLLEYLLKNAGAQYGVFIIFDEEGPKVMAKGQSSSSNILEVFDGISMEKFDQMAKTVVQFSIRSKESIVLADGQNSEYMNDYYIKQNKTKSILVVPLKQQGRVVGCAYMENNLTTDAFTKERIQLVQMISSQAAISIENARLYRNMEIKVEERTRQLTTRTRDIQRMLQNLKQGIFTIMSDYKIHPEYSRYLEDIFETKQIAGRNGIEFILEKSDIGPNNLSQAISALECMLTEKQVMYDLNCHLLPSEINTCFSNEENKQNKYKILELNWEPILDEDNIVEKIMVIVRDVTDIRALQRETEIQKRELTIINEILSCSILKFNDFISSSQRMIEECQLLLEKTSKDVELEIVQQLFRNIHTIKGNARLSQLNSLTDQLHEFEQTLVILDQEEQENWSKTEIVKNLSVLNNNIQEYVNLAESKLKVWGNMEESNQRDETIFHLFEEVIHALDSVATQLGKPMPIIEFKGPYLKIDSKQREYYQNIFMHLAKNSLDHSLEFEEERKQKGLPIRGTIYLRTEINDSNINIYIGDDGKGLNLRKIKEKAIELDSIDHQANYSDLELANLIFHPSFSTKDEVSTISGRGVGMDYIKNVVQKELGEISIQLKSDDLPTDPDHRHFEFLLQLKCG